MRIAFAIAGLVVLTGSLGAAALQLPAAPSFARPTSYVTGKGPYSVAMGDLTGDGKPELATANLDAKTVSVLRKGRVISQQPRPGTVLRSGGMVDLVVSRGRRR